MVLTVKSMIACSMVDTQSVSMADRYGSDECMLVGGEEGVCGREQSDLFVPDTRVVNRTMML